MKCDNCDKAAVITLQHGSLCKSHFINYFESKVFKTINKFKLIGRDENLCIATSGGKDSLTVLYLTKKYLKRYNNNSTLFALAVDEGITNYREQTLLDLKAFCNKHNVTLHVVSNKEEFGKTLDEAYPILKKKKPCNVCGVWRRYLLNKHARRLKASKVVTGHNLDDEAQVVLMNVFKANTKLAGRLGPISGIEENELFVQRVKPLYFCSEKEVRLYTLLKGFDVQFTECPYSQEGYRYVIQDLLNAMENKYKGTKQGIIHSFLDLLPLLQERERGRVGEVGKCSLCNEPCQTASREPAQCNACLMKEAVNAI
tara:strand:- start:6292 stop:7230 length:939 start_codon:yes stop_codon:yes gene_type:complete